MKVDSQFEFRLFHSEDALQLSNYYSSLSEQSRQFFQPHGFSEEEILTFYQANSAEGILISNTVTSPILAYGILLAGLKASDRNRYSGYSLSLDWATTGSLGPSVAEDWIGKGLSGILMKLLIEQAEFQKLKAVVLLGGVRADNHRAIAFYLKHGFSSVAEFSRNNTLNYDMILKL